MPFLLPGLIVDTLLLLLGAIELVEIPIFPVVFIHYFAHVHKSAHPDGASDLLFLLCRTLQHLGDLWPGQHLLYFPQEVGPHGSGLLVEALYCMHVDGYQFVEKFQGQVLRVVQLLKTDQLSNQLLGY